MVVYNTQIEIDRPVKDVYAVMSNIDKASQWITGLKKVEPLSGTPGQVGFESKYTFEERGKEVVFYEKILEVVPESHFSFHLRSDGIDMETKTVLKAQDGGTIVQMNNKVKANGLIMKLALPLMKGVMKKRQNQDLQQLKQLVEG